MTTEQKPEAGEVIEPYSLAVAELTEELEAEKRRTFAKLNDADARFNRDAEAYEKLLASERAGREHLERAATLLRESLDATFDGDNEAIKRMAREQREWLERDQRTPATPSEGPASPGEPGAKCEYCKRYPCGAAKDRNDAKQLRICRHATRLERDFLVNRVSRVEDALKLAESQLRAQAAENRKLRDAVTQLMISGSFCAGTEQWRVAIKQAEGALRVSPVAPAAEGDQQRGLYRKYEVNRLNDPTGKHRDCTYFVLDEVHDKHARPALLAYATSCADEFPELARDLRKRWCEECGGDGLAKLGGPCLGCCAELPPASPPASVAGGERCPQCGSREPNWKFNLQRGRGYLPCAHPWHGNEEPPSGQGPTEALTIGDVATRKALVAEGPWSDEAGVSALRVLIGNALAYAGELPSMVAHDADWSEIRHHVGHVEYELKEIQHVLDRKVADERAKGEP